MKPTKEMLAVAPNVPDAESVNKQLLDTLRRARKYVFSCAPHGGLLTAIDGAISAAEQQQTEPPPEPNKVTLTDDEIVEISERYTWYDADNERYDVIGASRAVIAADRAKRGA